MNTELLRLLQGLETAANILQIRAQGHAELLPQELAGVDDEQLAAQICRYAVDVHSIITAQAREA